MGVERVGNARRRRPAPAATPAEIQAQLIDQWLGLYASDPEFRHGRDGKTGLERFADEQALAVKHIIGLYGDENPGGYISWRRPSLGGLEPTPMVANYVRNVETFTTLWNLHLLPSHRGAAAVHAYCLARYRDGTEPQYFGVGASQYLPFPQQVLDPRLTITHRDSWKPTDEAIRDAKVRILKALERQLDAELERIAAEHERGGFDFRDTSSQQRRHLWWTYQNVVMGRSTAQIADAEALDERDARFLEQKHIANTIRDMRAALGIPRSRESTP